MITAYQTKVLEEAIRVKEQHSDWSNSAFETSLRTLGLWEAYQERNAPKDIFKEGTVVRLNGMVYAGVKLAGHWKWWGVHKQNMGAGTFQEMIEFFRSEIRNFKWENVLTYYIYAGEGTKVKDIR